MTVKDNRKTIATTKKAAKKSTKKATKKRNLVIVESPSKAKTIGKFLGSNYKVVASVGHVRDLPKSKIGIDIENDFEPQYINIRGKGDVIKELKKEAKNAKKVFLATDPDREGEAISWHLAHILGIDKDEPCRIVFNEITKNAIKGAVKNPRTINMELVDAQQARRTLDRLVGYSISPLLWRKIRRGLSAGRVQSAALKLICDREKDIDDFIPEEYWNITAHFKEKKKFPANLIKYNNRKIDIKCKAEADEVLSELEKGQFTVDKIEERERSRNPYPPYTTSSLQQDSANKINFGTRKTMQIAQQLYEGVDIRGMGTIGLVSYIRTDSVRVSEEARSAAREFIETNFSEEYYGGTIYNRNKKDSQDAHEAIRPSYVELTPESIKDSLTGDQFRLYSLIWRRFIASQMSSARYFNVSADIQNGEYTFRARGSKQIFDGYLRVYNIEKEEDKLLPDMIQGQKLNCEKVDSEQSFTQPPARYTEASLVKSLEDLGIGRPSTYAPIVATLTDRRYIKKEKKNLLPTELGVTVTRMMTEYFKEIVDSRFTAEMEEKLDEVGVEIKDWKTILRDFYKDFEKELAVADREIEKVEEEVQLTDIKCEICGKPMAKKMGRFGEFLACSGYPECMNTKPIVKEIGVKCPKCGNEIIQKKSRRGKVFYGCSGYPDCDQSYWDKPTRESCPECGSMLVEKNTKRFSGVVCSNQECDYKKTKEE